MLTAKQAQRASGIPSAQLLLMALTGQVPFHKDPNTCFILFDPVVLKEHSYGRSR